MQVRCYPELYLMRSRHNTDPYPNVLDHKPGLLLNWMLYQLFKHVQLPRDMAGILKKMHHEGTIVYAIKYRSHLDYLLYHYRFRRNRLPYPKIAFDMNISAFLPISHVIHVLKFQIHYFMKNHRLPNPYKTGFFEEAIRRGTASLLCLVDPKGFLKQFILSEKDNIHFLLETQKKMEKPIFLVPQLILYKMTPEKERPNIRDVLFGFKDKPGLIRKVVLFFRHNRRAFIDFGKPLNLKTYLENQSETRSIEDMAAEIRQTLIESIDLQKRVVLGPVMKTRHQIKEKVLKDKEVIQAIEKKAGGKEKKLKEVRTQADRIFDEIAADYNITFVRFFHMALTWLWKKIYQGIDVDTRELSVIRQWARKGSLIYVPSHKSHVDYLVLNYILFENHMHIPRIAAGQNLAFWPMGYIFRKSGAFFIRRTFRGTSLYPKIFARYIWQLLEEGHPLEFFIEGGRSRSGKLILPKTGFLSILLQAYEKGFVRDLVFVPASINYDTILEEKSYLKEREGGKKEKESFRQVLTAKRFLKRKHGKIYIRFGRPIPLKEYLARKQTSAGSTASHLLALDLVRSINRVTLVTPLALIASTILSTHRRGFQVADLAATARGFVDFLDRYEIPRARSFDHFEKTVSEVLSVLSERKVIELVEDTDDNGDYYLVNEEKKKELEYYKNSIIHYFISHSFVALSLLNGTNEKTDAMILDDYDFLKYLFRNEFVYDDTRNPHEEISGPLSYFLDISYIRRETDTEEYQITRLGYEKLPTWAALTRTFLESYWIATKVYLQPDSESIRRSELVKRMNRLGFRYHKLGRIQHLESVSQINFENAAKFIRENVSGSRKEPAKQRLQELSRRIQELTRFG